MECHFQPIHPFARKDHMLRVISNWKKIKRWRALIESRYGNWIWTIFRYWGSFDLPTYGKPGLTAQGKICHMWVGGSYPGVKRHCNVITRQKHLQSRSDNIYNVIDETDIIWCLEILNHLTISEQLSILTACQDEIAFVIIQRVEAKLHCFANHGDVAPKRFFCKLTLMVYIPGLKEIIGHDLTL